MVIYLRGDPLFSRSLSPRPCVACCTFKSDWRFLIELGRFNAWLHQKALVPQLKCNSTPGACDHPGAQSCNKILIINSVCPLYQNVSAKFNAHSGLISASTASGLLKAFLWEIWRRAKRRASSARNQAAGALNDFTDQQMKRMCLFNLLIFNIFMQILCTPTFIFAYLDQVELHVKCSSELGNVSSGHFLPVSCDSLSYEPAFVMAARRKGRCPKCALPMHTLIHRKCLGSVTPDQYRYRSV